MMRRTHFFETQKAGIEALQRKSAQQQREQSDLYTRTKAAIRQSDPTINAFDFTVFDHLNLNVNDELDSLLGKEKIKYLCYRINNLSDFEILTSHLFDEKSSITHLVLLFPENNPTLTNNVDLSKLLMNQKCKLQELGLPNVNAEDVVPTFYTNLKTSLAENKSPLAKLIINTNQLSLNMKSDLEHANTHITIAPTSPPICSN